MKRFSNTNVGNMVLLVKTAALKIKIMSMGQQLIFSNKKKGNQWKRQQMEYYGLELLLA
jgi:hypothetical protein